MMLEISLLPVPNQALSFEAGGSFYTLTIKEARGVMAVTVVRDGEAVVSSARAVANWPIIGYPHLNSGGDFVIVTTGDDLPDYSKFSTSQALAYLTAEEARAVMS